jgi:hypothetical protein
MFGSYDILTKLEAHTEENIQNNISTHIRKISNIRGTRTRAINNKLGILKVTKAEHEILDHHMTQALVTIHCLKSNEFKIMQNLEEIPGVIEVDMPIKNHEIICKVVSLTYNEIS